MLCLLVLTLFSVGILSANLPCSIEDSACLTEAAQEAYVKFIPENEALGVESSDPMHVELIDGDLSILKFKLFDTITTGFNNCIVGNVKISQDKSSVHLTLTCGSFDLRGRYDINGRLIILPVIGNGDYHIETKTYRIDVDAEVKLTPGDDGKTYASIKNFKVYPEAIGGILFEFLNLFNGQKDLSDTTHKYVNENWKEVGNFMQQPVFKAHFKILVKKVNKYLKTIPVEHFLQ